MDATIFDGLSRNLGSVSTRRSMFRLLGGAAALGAGVALATQEESLGKSRRNGRGQGNDREQVSAQGRGKGKRIIICYKGQTRTVKKKGYQDKYPGATKGACPTGSGTPGGGGGQPQVCTRWIISGGPNQTDLISADDDLYIANLSKGGQGILFGDNDRVASTYAPVEFVADMGDKLRIVPYDGGGCRSVSPLWLHCKATGQKRRLYAGYAGVGCNYSSGSFAVEEVEVWI